MNIPLSLFFLLCVGVGAARRTPLYDAFADGAKEGLQTAKRILPPLIAMLCAIRAFSASGLTDALSAFLAPALQGARIPKETLPLMLLRPLSGSASLAMLKEILHTYGPDSRIGLVASVMMGSSETVFYTCCVYLGAAGVRRSRHTIPCALLAWLAGSIAAGLLTPGW
ncbi:MAG: spore maturation protein [Clostridia bacterium]|nr:spore maturation protein [Clostridia bacterium]